MQSLPRRRRVYLLRHGEVSYYSNGQFHKNDSITLNEQGRAQAQAAAQCLAEAPFDRVICSDLQRTYDTATIIVGQRNLPIEVDPAFHEIRAGRLDHLPPDQLQRAFTEALTRPLVAEDRFLMGETFGELQARVLPAYHTLLADQSWRQLLLVAHGAVNRVILGEVLGSGLSLFGHLEQDPGCINIFDVDEQGYGIIRMLNFTPYNAIKQGIELTTMERSFLELTSLR
jgi:broad specificity phosphatase PhoE